MSEDSTFIGHEPCPSCREGGGDSRGDNLSRYSDGHGYCHSCEYYEHGDGTAPRRKARRRRPVDMLENTEVTFLKARGITEETCKHLDYHVGRTKKGKCQVAVYHDADGPVAQHLRYKDKSSMPWLGEASESYLFGQQAWKGGGRRLIITEGELDALSVDQVLGHRWPVVGVPGTDAAPKWITRNLEFVDSFEEVVLFFDQDEPGQKAARVCAELLEPGKARIVRSFPFNDANEALQAGEFELVAKAQWEAEPWWPDDIVESGSDEMLERLLEYKVEADYHYAWEQLDTMLRGMRRGEMTLWTAGTGVGKSQTLKDVVLHVLGDAHSQGRKIGLIMLEESIEMTHIILMSMHMGTDPMDWDEVDTDRRRQAYKEVFGDGRFLIYDHWGSLESKRLFSKMRAMVKGGCDIVVLDHISIVISGSDEADGGGGERRVIDKVMTKMETMVKEMQFVLHVISHLKKGDGRTSHEEGGQVSMDDLRGSQTLKGIPDIIVAVERNSQAEDEKSRCTALLRVLKNRPARKTGPADTVRFNLTTGRYDVVEDDLGFDDEPGEENQCEIDSDF